MPYITKSAKKDAIAGHPVPTSAPYDLDRCRWLIADGDRVPVVSLSRRTVTVDRYGQRHELKRRDLERDGVAHAGDVRFSVTTYQLSTDYPPIWRTLHDDQDTDTDTAEPGIDCF